MENVTKSQDNRGEKKGDFPFGNRHRTFICLCWAQFMGYEEIIEALLHRFDAHIKKHVPLDDEGEIFDRPAVCRFIYDKIAYIRNHPNGLKWRKLMEKLRREWKKAYFDEWIANKRPRLIKLQALYEEITKAVVEGKTASKSMKIAPDEWEKVFDLHITTRVNILREARRETEPDFLGLLDLDVSALTDEQLQRVEDGENLISVLHATGGGDTGTTAEESASN